MTEEKQQPIMDAETWAAIQRGKDLTDDIFRDLNREEQAKIGQIRVEDLDEFDTPPSDKPESITRDPQEYEVMRDRYTRGQNLATFVSMNKVAWEDVQWIMEQRVEYLRDELHRLESTVPSSLVYNMFLEARITEKAYAYLKSTMQELMALPKPQLRQRGEVSES